MYDTAHNLGLEQELRYALDVMEESSHLGLDDEFAGKLRKILQRRIEEASASTLSRPTEPICFSARVSG